MAGEDGTREGNRLVGHSVFGDVIATYSRQQALADGTLVDVTNMAREAGIRYPTALTSAVWNRYVEVPDGVPGQDKEGRCWDIVWMLRYGTAKSSGGQQLHFKLYVANEPGRSKLITLKAMCGPGDRGEPVITVMLPEED
jgi:hypothetical protein